MDYCNTVLNLQSVDGAGDSRSIKSVSQGRSQEFVSEGTKEGVPFRAGETQMGSGGSLQKPEKHAERSIECHKFCTVWRKTFSAMGI